MHPRIYLSLGSNLGDRLEYLRRGLARLRALDCLSVIRVSSVYNTEPVGGETEKDFLNAVVECSSECDPRNILPLLKEIERHVGRVDRKKWGDRELDIDLLFAGDAVISSAEAKIPHPEISQRRFVLIPLCELSPSFVDPLSGKRVADLLRECRGVERVERIESMF